MEIDGKVTTTTFGSPIGRLNPKKQRKTYERTKFMNNIPNGAYGERDKVRAMQS